MFYTLDSRLDLSKNIFDFLDEFDWKFGPKVGLQAQWLEAWWPSSDHEFAFVVEDDLELSPFYYRFLKGLILNYFYNASNFSPSVYGASLQRPRFVPGKHGNKMHLDGEARIFLYQLVGTWGQLLFPRPWKEFRLWYDEHKAKGMKPLLDGMYIFLQTFIAQEQICLKRLWVTKAPAWTVSYWAVSKRERVYIKLVIHVW